MGDVVEGGKSTVESVEVEEYPSRGVRWDAGVERNMSRVMPGLSAFPMKDNILCLCNLPHVRQQIWRCW